jgi:hypothetical protein
MESSESFRADFMTNCQKNMRVCHHGTGERCPVRCKIGFTDDSGMVNGLPPGMMSGQKPALKEWTSLLKDMRLKESEVAEVSRFMPLFRDLY